MKQFILLIVVKLFLSFLSQYRTVFDLPHLHPNQNALDLTHSNQIFRVLDLPDHNLPVLDLPFPSQTFLHLSCFNETVFDLPHWKKNLQESSLVQYPNQTVIPWSLSFKSSSSYLIIPFKEFLVFLFPIK